MVSAASLFVSAWRGCSAQGKSRTVVPQGTGACLAIRPVFQGQHYKRVPQAGGQLQVVHCQQAPLVRFHQVRTDPLLWEDFDLPHFHLREFTAVGGIHQNRPFLSCLFRAVVQQGMAAVGQSDTESLLLRLDMLIPLYSVTSNNP